MLVYRGKRGIVLLLLLVFETAKRVEIVLYLRERIQRCLATCRFPKSRFPGSYPGF